MFIIGGASSQGASHARAYLAEEANVVVTDIRDVGGRSRVADLGERVHDLHLGVAREEDWADAVVAIER